ncbi:MAG: glycosyltransferase, partial [Acidimicrobiia bacterium]
MRILFAHSFYRASGGEDRHVHEQVELVSQAHDVELIAEANLDLSESPATAARMLYSHTKKRETGLIIDRFSPDIVHIHNMYPSIGPAVLLAAIQRRIPVVLTVHNYRLRCPNGLMFTEGGTCRRCESGLYVNALTHRCFPTRKQAGAYAAVLWAHRFAMRLERHVSRFVVPSEFMRQRLLEWGFEEERIRMVRHFIRS